MSSASGEKPSFFARISKAVATKLPNNNKDTTNTTNSPTSPATTTTTTTTTSNTPASPTSTTPSSSSTSTQPRRQHHRTDSSQLDVSTAWRWQQRAVASALQQLAAAHTVAAPSASSTLRVRRLLELSRSAMETAVALMLAEERDNAFRTALALAVNDTSSSTSTNTTNVVCARCGATSGGPICAKCVADVSSASDANPQQQQQEHLIAISLLRSLAERLVDAGNAHAAALGALTERSLVQKDANDALAAAAATNAVSEDTVAAATTSGAAQGDDDDDVSSSSEGSATIQAATAAAAKMTLADPNATLQSALKRGSISARRSDAAEHVDGAAFGEFDDDDDGAASSSSDGDYDDDDDGVFVDEHEHVGSSNPDEAWPCYAIAVVDGVWRERDLRAIATMHNPPTRRETMRMLASWIDNAAHPHGRAMSLFLAALLHCVAAHRAGATQARVRLADASRVLPAGIGGAHRCRVCGNQYPTSTDLETHMQRRHAQTSSSSSSTAASSAVAQRNDQEDARALLDEAVVSTKSFIASTFSSLRRQYPMLAARALRDSLEHVVLERVYPHLAALYAHADEHVSAQLDDRIDALSDLHPAVFDIGELYWPLLGVREPPTREGGLTRVDSDGARRARSLGGSGSAEPPPGVDRSNLILQRAGPPLNALASYTSVSGKLRALAAVGGIIARCVERHFGATSRVVLGADDLLPLMCYVVIRTRPRSLLSQLHAMEAFITRDAVNGKYGYFLVTATMAVDYISNLNIATLKADFLQKATAAHTKFSSSSDAGDTLSTRTKPIVESATLPKASTLSPPATASSSTSGLLSLSLSPRSRPSVAAATLAPPSVAADSGTCVVQVNMTRAQVAEFFQLFGVIGDEDVLLRHSCLCKESSSLRRGSLVVTTRRLAFYRKSVQIAAEWANVRSVARRRSGTAFSASIEVAVRVAPDSDVNAIYTFAAFQVTIDSVLERMEAARRGAKLFLYREFACKWTLPVDDSGKAAQQRTIVLRVDENDATLFDSHTKELIEKHSLRRMRQWSMQQGHHVVVDIGSGEARIFTYESADDLICWLQFITNRIAARGTSAPGKQFMSDYVERPGEATSPTAAAATSVTAPEVATTEPAAVVTLSTPDSMRNKAAIGSRQLQQLASMLDSRATKHLAALRADALLAAVTDLAAANDGAESTAPSASVQTLLSLAERLEACKPEDIRPSRSSSLVLAEPVVPESSESVAAASTTTPASPPPEAETDSRRQRSRTRDWHALCTNYCTNVRDIVVQEVAPLRVLWRVATASKSDDASALLDALSPVRTTLMALLEAVGTVDITLGNDTDRHVDSAVDAVKDLQ